MATKKYIELQDFSDDDLVAEIAQTETQYKNLKFDHAVKGLDNPLSLREIRKDLARLKTEARKRELAGLSADQLAKRSKIVERRRGK